jgi:hypothetical protein
MDNETSDEARERVCQKAFDCLTSGHGFDIMDANDTSIFKHGPADAREEQVRIRRAAQERLRRWPDHLVIDAYVDIE